MSKWTWVESEFSFDVEYNGEIVASLSECERKTYPRKDWLQNFEYMKRKAADKMVKDAAFSRLNGDIDAWREWRNSPAFPQELESLLAE